MTLTQAETYTPVVWQAFKTGMDMIESKISLLFNVQGSTNAKEYHVGLGGSSTEVWDEFGRSGITGYMDQEIGWPTTLTPGEKTARFSLRRSDIEDPGAFNVVTESLENAGMNLQIKKEQDAASVFNNAFSGSFLGADGVALCSDSHPQAPDNTGATYDNLSTAQFNYTNLTASRTQLRNLEDSFETPLMRRGTLILHPIDLTKVVDEVLFATGKPGTADNDGSSARGFQAEEWDFLSDADNWFLIDPTWIKRSLKWYNRVMLQVMVVAETTTHIEYEFRSKYSYGWVDPRWLIGHSV